MVHSEENDVHWWGWNYITRFWTLFESFSEKLNQGPEYGKVEFEGVVAAYLDNKPLNKLQMGAGAQVDEDTITKAAQAKPQVPAGFVDNDRLLRRPWPENDENLKKFTVDYGCQLATCASGLRHLVNGLGFYGFPFKN